MIGKHFILSVDDKDRYPLGRVPSPEWRLNPSSFGAETQFLLSFCNKDLKLFRKVTFPWLEMGNVMNLGPLSRK